MAPVISRYPLDLSGNNRNNFIPNEVRTLKHLEKRTIIPHNGAFFANTLRILDLVSQTYLIPGEQYKLDCLNPEATRRSGKAVYGVIVIDDIDVSDNVALQYQAVGGEYANSFNAIAQMLGTMAVDTRAISASSVANWPTTFTPVLHLHSLGDGTAMEALTHSIERIRAAVALKDLITHDYIYQYADSKLTSITYTGVDYANSLMTSHDGDSHAHTQYVRRDEVASALNTIRQPVNAVPSAGQLNVALDATLQAGNYYSVYRVPQGSARFQISSNAAFSGILEVDAVVNGAVTSYHYLGQLAINKVYYWRCMFTDVEGVQSSWSNVTQFTTRATIISQPSIQSPGDGTTVNSDTLTLTSSPFAVSGGTDTHLSTDWEIWTGPNGTGIRIWSSLANTANKTVITLPPGALARDSTYYPRVRYNGTTVGTSAWSGNVSFFITWPLRPTVLGQSFGGGYWGGDVAMPDGTYAIIVAPKSAGELARQLYSTLTATAGAASSRDSVANTTWLKNSGQSQAATWATALNISSFTDWTIPSTDVLSILQSNLSPGNSGSPAAYQTGGAEAFNTVTSYWSSTTYDYVSGVNYYQAYSHTFANSNRGLEDKTATRYVRAVRLVKVA